MSTSTMPPQELAHLGKPLQAYTPPEELTIPPLQVAAVLAFSMGGLGGFGLAAFFAGWIGQPAQPIPPMVSLIGGIAFALMGVVLLAIAWSYLAGFGVCAQTYLVYPEQLVEVKGERHRAIPWDQVGPQRLLDKNDYNFPVHAGSAIRFDGTMPDHAALGQAIIHHSMLARLGGRASSLPTGTPAPYFLVRTGSMRINEQTYRVSRVGDQLLFLHVGMGGDGPPPAFDPDQFHTTPMWMRALSAWQLEEEYKQFQANMKKVADVDERELFRQAPAFPGSFMLAAADVTAARILPPSGWRALIGDKAPVLELIHAQDGPQTWYFLSMAETATAAQVLSKICDVQSSLA